jgi:hypothetical protein
MFTIEDVVEHPGSIFFVHSGTGTDGAGYGRNPDSPLATVDYAVGLCTASKGDVIYVLPGHAETLAGATALVLDVIGVKVIGIGHGTLKPVFTLTHTAALLSITAANCWVENIRLVGDVDNIVTGISLGALADGCVLKNVELIDGATNKEFLVGVAIAAACHDVLLDGVKMFGLAGGATACISLAGASDRLIIRNCYLQGTFSTALIDASGAASANLNIHDNFLMQRDAAAGLVFKGHATNAGWMARNFVFGSKTNTETINTVGNMHFAENYGTDAVGTTGILTPSTATNWGA